jgi:23S rRNA pseudouridine2605 synthase
MRSKKEENSRQSRNTSPSNEGTKRKSTPKRSLSEKKTSSNKTESSKEVDKRKARRSFFTEGKQDGSRKRFGSSSAGRYDKERSSSRRNDDGFDKGKRERKPDFRTDTESEGKRSYRRNDRDTSYRERNFSDKGKRERKPAFRTDAGSEGERSYRRNDRDTSNRERKYTDKGKRERKPAFRTDTESEGGRSYRRNDRDTSYRKRDFTREDRERDYGYKPRKERRSTVLDSEIMREIVQKRRATGRSSHKPKVLSLAWSEDRGPIRLNKYIANSGICSRREADSLITAGAITVNGKVVTELGTKVMPVDEVRYEDKLLQREKPVYILLNKPRGYITTTDDERGRDNVMMLIEGACSERVYPVGRLDRETTGLLLFTNDGEMTKKLTHPRHGVKKIYQVELDMDMSLVDFETLANGIELDDGFMKPDEVAFVDGQKDVIGIELHSGQNRIVRRLFAHLGYEIEKLDRVYYAGLTKKNLSRGEWRFLHQDEINILKRSL